MSIINRNHQHDESDLKQALEQLESCLETPLVPGELRSWLQTVQSPLERCCRVFQREVEESHRDLLEGILRSDMGLAHRVEAMRTADQQLIASWQELEHQLAALRDLAVEGEHNETRLSEPLAHFTQCAIELVIEVRKQEAALTTWYLESLNRDRGNAD